jgi:hypothetical protein
MGEGSACRSGGGGDRGGEWAYDVASPPSCPVAGAAEAPLPLAAPLCRRDGDCGGVKVAVAANTSAAAPVQAAASVRRASRLETGAGVGCCAAGSRSACAPCTSSCTAVALLSADVGVLANG